MGCVSALLLHELTEEQTFWVMVALTTDPRYKLWGFWHPKMPLVHQVIQKNHSFSQFSPYHQRVFEKL